MTYSELKQAIYNWASDNINILVIFANENAPRPNEPYVTINITTIAMQGQADYSSPDNNGDRNIKYDEDVFVSIQSYGSNALNNLQELKDSLQKDIVLQSLRCAGLAVRDDTGITNTSIPIDRTIEKRYLYEITFGFARQISENVGVIEDFEYTYTVNQPT